MNNDIVYYRFDGMTIECRVSNYCISIIDSYQVTDDDVKKEIINDLLESFPYFREHRTPENMLVEWKAHNILYQHKIQRERTKTTDLEAKPDLFHRIGYAIIVFLFKEKVV